MPIIIEPAVAGAEILVFDPVSEDDANAELVVGAGTAYGLVEHSYPAAPLNVQYASSADTEGDRAVSRRHGNREITIQLDMDDETGALQADLEAKFAKLQAEGGTLQRTFKNGDVRIYDIVAADNWSPEYDLKYYLGQVTQVSLTLPAGPYSRGIETDLGDNVQTVGPALVFTATDIAGNVPALGRLVIDDDSGVDQQWVIWAVETAMHYDITPTTAGLFHEAETLTPLGGSTTAVGPTGASGGGSNVMRNTALTTSYQAILSSQAVSGGLHWTHVGELRAFARVQAPTSNSDPVSLALEWSEGDFRRYTQNATVTLDTLWEGTWRIVDLGSVTIPNPSRWEARILAKSTAAGDDINVDWIMLIPTDTGSGEVRSVARPFTPTAFTVRDEFDQTAGALAGKTLPVGGTWTGAGDADVFSVSGSGTVTRTAVSDSATLATGRFGIAGTSSLTTVAVQTDVNTSVAVTAAQGFGVFARYSSTANWIIAAAYPTEIGQNQWLMFVMKAVAGVETTLWAARVTGLTYNPPPEPGVSLRLVVSTAGRWDVWMHRSSAHPLILMASGQHADLATGGALATGNVGIYDHYTSATAMTRTYDNFWAAVPPVDAAVFANQSVQVSHEAVVRDDSTGTFPQAPARYDGDYLRIPPSGSQARAARVIVKMSRSAPGDGPDSAIDDLSARLYVTPRYLT